MPGLPSIFFFPPRSEREERGCHPGPGLASSQSPHRGQRPAPRSGLDQSAASPGWSLTNGEAGSGEQSTNAGRDLDNLGQRRWEVVGPGAPSTHQHRERDFKTTFLLHYICKEVSTKWCCTKCLLTRWMFPTCTGNCPVSQSVTHSQNSLDISGLTGYEMNFQSSLPVCLR